MSYATSAVSGTSPTFTVRGRDGCFFGGEHSPSLRVLRLTLNVVGGHHKTTIVSPSLLCALAGLVVSSKPPSFHRALGITACCAAPAAIAVACGCCLRSIGFLKMTSRILCDAWLDSGYVFTCLSTKPLGRISFFLHEGGHGRSRPALVQALVFSTLQKTSESLWRSRLHQLENRPVHHDSSVFRACHGRGCLGSGRRWPSVPQHDDQSKEHLHWLIWVGIPMM